MAIERYTGLASVLETIRWQDGITQATLTDQVGGLGGRSVVAERVAELEQIGLIHSPPGRAPPPQEGGPPSSCRSTPRPATSLAWTLPRMKWSSALPISPAPCSAPDTGNYATSAKDPHGSWTRSMRSLTTSSGSKAATTCWGGSAWDSPVRSISIPALLLAYRSCRVGRTTPPYGKSSRRAGRFRHGWTIESIFWPWLK